MRLGWLDDFAMRRLKHRAEKKSMLYVFGERRKVVFGEFNIPEGQGKIYREQESAISRAVT